MSLKSKGQKPTSRPSGMIPRKEVQSAEGRHSDSAKSSWSWKLALTPHLRMSPPDLLSSQQSGACSRFLTLAKQPFSFSGSVFFLAIPPLMASFLPLLASKMILGTDPVVLARRPASWAHVSCQPLGPTQKSWDHGPSSSTNGPIWRNWSWLQLLYKMIQLDFYCIV